MNIVIKYFGLIVDLTHKNEEVLEIATQELTIEAVKTILIKKYPPLAKTNFKIALNQSLVVADTAIQTNDVIALLPPFAGG